MDELSYVVEALLLLDLVIGNLDDVEPMLVSAVARSASERLAASLSWAERPWHSKMTPMLSVALSMRISA